MRILRAATWNVNGLKKLRSAMRVGFGLPFLFHVLLAQETFLLSVKKEPFHLPGFIDFHVEAVATGGRPSGGLSCFFDAEEFKNGSLQDEPSPLKWVQAIRWIPESGTSVLFLNIYVPKFTA